MSLSIPTLRPVLGLFCASAALASGLNAGSAAALTFNFSFDGSSGFSTPNFPASVTGTISGLADNANNQTTGLTATIVSATNTPSVGWVVFSNYLSGTGISVVNGTVTDANIAFSAVNGSENYYLALSNSSGLYSELQYYLDPGFQDFTQTADFNNPPDSTIVFTPTSGPSSVPAPLPLFGAAAFFNWSRRLRLRVSALS